jgi:two-component system nitrogen regulation response regulator NtrX
VDVRLIAATNKDIKSMVETTQFREDLFYRLNVIHIHLPALKDRKEDIPDLVQFFLSRFCVEHNRKPKRISKRALEFIIEQGWPGNIRELKNFIEKIVITVDEEMVDIHHVQALYRFRTSQPSMKKDLTLREARRDFEYRFILSKLIVNEWNVSQTADELGMERTAFYRKMKDLNIRQPE